MRASEDVLEAEWSASSQLQTPFAEAANDGGAGEAVGFGAWNETVTPFAEAAGETIPESELDRQFAEAFAGVQDEAFDEAVAFLAEETEQAVAERFTGEAWSSGAERERYADARLSEVRYEAEQYLDSLEAGLAGLDVASLTDEQFDEVLDRFDPSAGELTPAGEEFIGALVRKAKKVAKFVSTTAKTVGKVATGAVLGPVLKKLRGLINPLLKRVLSFAIGRLPPPLQPAARQLASRFTSEAEAEELDEAQMSPANLSDVETLTEEFDAAIAEAMTADPAGELEEEAFDSRDGEGETDGRALEALAEARSALIDRLGSDEGEGVAPAVEQFVPALLGALRLGINLVGRPKVVRFLAKYLGQLIGRWVGPEQSQPLSNAIVDTGLRLVSLEAEDVETAGEAGPVALASVVEDTIRSLAEQEDYIFENDELMQLAAAEAFSRAVATNFPPQFVRSDLQQAPSLGGTFVARRPRNLRTYRKFSRTPDIDVTAQIADTLPTFGGTTVGAAMRANGATFPLRARMHIYQATAGTTLPAVARMDRTVAGAGRGFTSTSAFHPLTPQAAGLLLREPKLGAAVPAAFLRSRNRIAAGQRFYVLQPLGAAGQAALPPSAAGRAAGARLGPSRAWTAVNAARGRVTVGIFLSEAEAQRIAEAMRQGRGQAALLQALVATYRAAQGAGASPRPQREDGEAFEEFAAKARGVSPALAARLRRKLDAWVLPALAAWVRSNGEAFIRAAAHPDPGVTVRVRLTGVPGLATLGQAAAGPNALRGTPAIAITVTPGTRRG